MNLDFIYNILLVKYMNKYNIKEEMFVFPNGFFYGDTNTRIEILSEALNNNIKLNETKKYLQCLEGVEISREI